MKLLKILKISKKTDLWNRKGFLLKLKTLFSAIYLNDYRVLVNSKEDRIKKYIKNYIYKVFEYLVNMKKEKRI